jgi:hypothetical protein
MSTRNRKKYFWRAKRFRCIGLTTLLPSVNQLSRQCGILNISQSYRPPLPITRIALLLHFYDLENASNFHLLSPLELNTRNISHGRKVKLPVTNSIQRSPIWDCSYSATQIHHINVTMSTIILCLMLIIIRWIKATASLSVSLRSILILCSLPSNLFLQIFLFLDFVCIS